MVNTSRNTTTKLMLIKIPTLLLFGELDTIISPRRAKDVFDEIFFDGIPKSIRYTLIPRLGHFMHNEDPEQICQHIKDFEEKL